MKVLEWHFANKWLFCLCHPINTKNLIYKTWGNLGVLGCRFADFEKLWTAVTIFVLAFRPTSQVWDKRLLDLRDLSVIWDISTMRWAGIESIKFSPDLGGAGGTARTRATSLFSSIIRERERERLQVSIIGSMAPWHSFYLYEAHRGEFPAV